MLNLLKFALKPKLHKRILCIQVVSEEKHNTETTCTQGYIKMKESELTKLIIQALKSKTN